MVKIFAQKSLKMETKLIENVRLRECLWNRKSKGYRNTEFKEKLWSEVAEICGISSGRARQRWKSLRDRFKIESKKMKFAAEHDLDDEPETNWQYLDNLMFLQPGGTGKKTETVLKFMKTENHRQSNDAVSSDDNVRDEITQTRKWASNNVPGAGNGQPQNNSQHLRNEVLLKTGNEFLELISSVKESLQHKTAIRLFLESLGMQIEEANLSRLEWLELQEKLFHTTMEAIRESDEKRN